MKNLQEFEELLKEKLMIIRNKQIPPADIAAGGLIMLSQAIESSKSKQKLKNIAKLYNILFFLKNTKKVDAFEEATALEAFEGFGGPDPIVPTFKEAKGMLLKNNPPDIDFKIIAASVCVMLKFIDKPGNLQSSAHLHLNEQFSELEFLLED